MPTNHNSDFIQGSLFEEDYLLRSLGTLAYLPEIALTELVANAWDAGATLVKITIPDELDGKLVIEDNGIGLTKQQFNERWMKLGYNRIRHQGKNVIFPPNVQGKRLAYGRNGVGRHGLLCFNSEYTVITDSQGIESTFVVTTHNEKDPFVVKEESFRNSNTFGTRLEVIVSKHLPKADKVLETISARFLHDPNFQLSINNQTVPLEQHSGLIDTSPITVGDITLLAHFIDSQKSAKSTIYQGIAFWQSNRLVGEPSWILGSEAIIDGRTREAKRYTVVVKSDDLAEFIYEDWTGFKKVDQMNDIYVEVSKYVNRMFNKIALENIHETKQRIRTEISEDFSKLSPLAKYEVNEAIESITTLHPTEKSETLAFAVKAIINLEKTRTGKELLLRLALLSDDDIQGLNKLLESWSVRDALTVLDEIDNRISIIEAINKLSNDKDVDELHVLHPLVTSARWLFGPEFESAEFASNQQLQTAVETVFKKKISKNVFNNHRKRPDIVVLPNSTFSVTGTETFDESNISTINRILIIELKRGDFKHTREERNQAQNYVDDFIGCGALIGNPYIDAFVIGKTFAEKLQPITTIKNENSVEMGKIRVTLFSQLVDTANRRLFQLRKKLGGKYDDVLGMDLFATQEAQVKLDFDSFGNNGIGVKQN